MSPLLQVYTGLQKLKLGPPFYDLFLRDYRQCYVVLQPFSKVNMILPSKFRSRPIKKGSIS